jgi:Zn-dependent M28 family amino/carboxypeptidase
VEIGPRTPIDGDSLARAERYIRGVLEDCGLHVSAQEYEFRGQRVANLIAVPDGVDTRAPYYVVGAHYDTVPSTPGADDNASAVAVLLEVARRVATAPPAAPVRLAAFTLEEPPAHTTGQQGSRVFARERKKAGDAILGALVLEMVGYTCPRQEYPFVLKWAGYPQAGNYIGVVGNRRSRRLGRAVLKGFKKNERLPAESLFVPFNGWVLPATRLSDHAAFWDQGWPALMITDTAFFRNPNYHRPSDTAETLDYGFMAELVESLELALAELPPG